jgi:hypothetical protein
MNLRFKIALTFIALSVLGRSQSGFTTLGGANFLGYSRAGVNITGIESMYLNQAGLTSIKKVAFDISTERRFNIEELTTISIAGAKTYKFGTVGFLMSSFGFSQFNEQKFGLAYARKLTKTVSLGGQFNMLRYNVEQYGSKNLFTFELGVQIQISKEISVATHIFSPGQLSINDKSDIGTRFRFGFKYMPSTKVFLLAELDKLIYRPVEYKLGISYQAVEALQIRLGINPSAELYSFGAMVSIQKVYRISSAIALNNRLGNTPSFSLQYVN